MKKSFLFGTFLWLILFGLAASVSAEPKKIDAHKECPLCGMYPARYPDFQCQVLFEDGSYEAFDSAIGMLIYLLFQEKTDPKESAIDLLYFKDYNKKSWIEANNTWFVVGSEIMGPMGVEFLPVDSKQAAEKLKIQEKGQEIIHYKNIDRAYMKRAAKSGWLHFLANKLVLE
ncbi:MAG: hypothetical protein GY702_18495 [Desulfobulbaceae bacterium]|nr:hypothetical protein [Desulfobulbaceae bacterium]